MIHNNNCCCSACSGAKRSSAIHNRLVNSARERVKSVKQKFSSHKVHEQSTISGIRQPYPTSATQFAAMKANPTSDFVGGYLQSYEQDGPGVSPDYFKNLHKDDAHDLLSHMGAYKQLVREEAQRNWQKSKVISMDNIDEISAILNDEGLVRRSLVIDPNDITMKSTMPRRPVVEVPGVDYFVDLETVDIRSTRQSKYTHTRPINEPIGIVEFATYRRSKANPMKIIPMGSGTGFTEIITKKMLQEYGVTSHKDIPESFIETLVTDRVSGAGSRFSENMLSEGNTLRTVLENTVKAATTGIVPGTKETPAKFAKTSKYLKGLVSAWEKTQADGGKVVFNAWNAGFDIARIADSVQRLGSDSLQQRFNNIVGDADYFDIVDLSDPVKQAHVDRMLRDKRYAPVFINAREVEDAFSKGVSTKEIIQSVRSGESPYLKRNEAVRSFFDDVEMYRKKSSNKKEIFASRLRRAYNDGNVKLNISRKETRESIIDLISTQLASVAETVPNRGNELPALRRAGNALKTHDLSRYIEKFLIGAYNPDAGKLSLFGNKVGFSETVRPDLVAGLTTGLDFISGWSHDAWDSLGQIGSTRTGSKNHLAFYDAPASKDTSDRVRTLNEISRGHHPASNLHPSAFKDVKIADTRQAKHSWQLMEEWLQDGARQPGVFKTMQERAQAEIEGRMESGRDMSATKRITAMKEHKTGMGKPSKEVLDKVRTIDNIGKKALKRKGGSWLKGAAILSGLYLLSDWNRESQIEGLRQPEGQYDQIGGISPSGDQLFGDFGSGRNQMLQISESQYTPRISASMLGYRGEHLENMLLGLDAPMWVQGTAERGQNTHNMIEQIFMQNGLAQAAEHTVYDEDLNIKGRIDLWLPSGIPLEIKTVEDYDALMALKSPKDPHVSQANFYAYAANTPYSMIGYAARNDPHRIKYFKVDKDNERLSRDVAAVRQVQNQLIDSGRLNKLELGMHEVASTMRLYQTRFLDSGYSLPFRIPGMIAETGYNAIRQLGDYTKHNVENTYRMERPKVDTRGCTGRAKVRNQQSRCFVQPVYTPRRLNMNRSRSNNYHDGGLA